MGSELVAPLFLNSALGGSEWRASRPIWNGSLRLEDLDIDGRMASKLTSRKQEVSVWTGFVRFRVSFSGSFM
jgi:hypothetical protein